MTESLTCAICGGPVGLDSDHHVVRDEQKRMRDRDEQDDYYLHERCAEATFSGWRTP